jgi:hypothetical protein
MVILLKKRKHLLVDRVFWKCSFDNIRVIMHIAERIIAKMQIDEIRRYDFRRSAISRMLLSTLSVFFHLHFDDRNYESRLKMQPVLSLGIHHNAWYIFKKSDRKGWLTERKIVNEKNASIDYRKHSAISISMIFLFDNVCFDVNFDHFTFRWWGTQSIPRRIKICFHAKGSTSSK